MNGKSPDGRLTETRFSLLEQRVGGIEHALTDLTSKIESWMQSRQTNPWRLVALLLGILVPLGWILNMYITSAISPWAGIANQAKATSDANSTILSALSQEMGTVRGQNADSIRDRSDQRARLDRATDLQNDINKAFAREQADRLATQREIETQFDADSQLRNVQWATIMRKLNETQNAMSAAGMKIPQNGDGPYYFPNISGRESKAESRQ